jgi:hypothetical protein
MRLLTTREAAEMLSEGMRRHVTAGRVEDAIERGRLRAEKDPGGRDAHLVPMDEVVRVIEESYRKRDPDTEVWDMLPSRSSDLFWRTRWMPHRSPASSMSEDQLAELIDRLRKRFS